MAAELAPQIQRLGIARRGPVVGLLARRAAPDEKAAAAIVLVVAVQIGHSADFAGPRMLAAIELAADHHAGAHARAERDADHVAIAVRLAVTADAQREAVAVVVHADRHAEPLLEAILEIHLAPRRDIHHIIYDTPGRIDDRRHPDADAGHLRRHQRADERGDLLEYLLLGAARLAGFRKQPHDTVLLNQSDTYVRAAQIHSNNHRYYSVSMILPSVKRT